MVMHEDRWRRLSMDNVFAQAPNQWRKNQRKRV